MKRTLSVFVVACMTAQTVTPLSAQQPASNVTLTALSRASVRPFDRLTITGSGFDPTSASISAVFIPKQHGAPVAVPAVNATATSIEVIVPPLLDPAAGDFGFGQVDVQVVQVSRTTVQSSNVLSGLDVAPIPKLSSSVKPGAVTRAVMHVSADFLATPNSSFMSSTAPIPVW